MSWGTPSALLLLVLVPLVFLVHLHLERKQQKRLAQAGEEALLRRFIETSRHPADTRLYRTAFVALAILFLVISLARPQLGVITEYKKTRGMDIVIALDLSRSMLVRDVVPSRLDRAKAELEELLRSLRGDRVGLVGFSTEAMTLCPLTVDHSSLVLQLESVEPKDLAGGGTAIAEALAVSIDLLSSIEADGAAQQILLVTDGEEHEGAPEPVATEAQQMGIAVHTIGVGTRTGEPIPVLDARGDERGFVKDIAGQTVISRLDEGRIQQIAEAGGGLAALPGEEGGLDLSSLVQHLTQLKKAEREARAIRVHEERYQWPLVPALLCLLIASLFRPTRRRITILLLLFCCSSDVAQAAPWHREDPDIRSGNEALRTNRPAVALEAYRNASVRLGQTTDLLFNRGLALSARGDHGSAAHNFVQVIARARALQDRRMEASASFALGNAYRQLAQPDRAIAAYKRALVLDPTLVGARRNLEITQRLQIEQSDPGRSEDASFDGGVDGGIDGSTADAQSDGGMDGETIGDGGMDGGALGEPSADEEHPPPTERSKQGTNVGDRQRRSEEEEEEVLTRQDVLQVLDSLKEQEKAVIQKLRRRHQRGKRSQKAW